MTKRGGKNAEAWTFAKRACRLSARHVEMAKKLGMNPKKLPGLNPSKSEPWKAPVRVFIEDCYRKRFGEEMSEPAGQRTKGRDATRRGGGEKRPRSKTTGEPNEARPVATTLRTTEDHRAVDAICHLENLRIDLEEELASGDLTPDVLHRLAKKLRQLADDLDSGRSVSQFPFDDFEDDEIPF